MAVEISVQEAAQLLGEQGGVLLDVREPGEWREVRASGALHIPVGQLSTSTEQLPSQQRIACICHAGGRSTRVAEALTGAGYDAVTVRGGMEAWEAAGLPIERG